jgi:hypothetical protein
MPSYRCEWRIDIEADDPVKAAEEAARQMADAIKTKDHNIWTVIDEEGEEMEIGFQGAEFEELPQ